MQIKFIILICFLLSFNFALADNFDNVGISKYAVLEVINDNAPLRQSDNENALRLTHLYKNVVLFADKQNENYYRVELKDDSYAYINKKFVEVQAIIPEKRYDNVEKITFKNEKNKFIAKIETPFKSAFIVNEEGQNLDFTLYDNFYDPIETKVNNQNSKFILSEKIENELNIKYLNDSKLFGYDVESDDFGYVLSVKKPPKINPKKPLKNIIVTLDPGHGGSEKGASGFGYDEKDINLQIAKILKKELKKRGAKVYMTRSKDKKVALYDRVNFAKEKNSDILLSIHQNSLSNPKDVEKKHGTGTYYYNAQSKPLAESIQNNLLKETKFKDDKVNYASFALTRPTSQLSVLIECGYIIKEDEAKKLADKAFQKIIAKAITKGCEDYLKENFSKT